MGKDDSLDDIATQDESDDNDSLDIPRGVWSITQEGKDYLRRNSPE